jgi:transcriptional regulator with XRE-family HTH domain
MTISERIFKLMEEREVTQMEFSKATGIAQSTISDWKRKKTNPSADKIMIICKVLNEMIEGDNPPVGILLCTDKGAQMVEYALSGMDNQLFVSTYMLHLPDKQKLETFLRKELEEIE